MTWRIKDITNQRFDLSNHKRIPHNKNRRYPTYQAALDDAIAQSRPSKRSLEFLSMVFTVEDTQSNQSMLRSGNWIWSEQYKNYLYSEGVRV